MSNETLRIMYTESVAFIKSKTDGMRPKVGLMLGSGLGALAGFLTDRVELPYGDIPNFPVSTVKGHAGMLVAGKMDGIDVVILRGRFHNYEGWEAWQMTYGVRVMKLLGVEKMIIVNAAGGVNRAFRQGDLMLIRDHISVFAPSPLRGQNMDDFGTRFPDMTHAYCKEAIDIAIQAGREECVEFRQGVYAFAQGPMYETPAEIRMFSLLGADTIGMSTVTEVITACHAGIQVLGISCVTNMAAGIQTTPLHHQEVLDTERAVEAKLSCVIRKVISRWV